MKAFIFEVLNHSAVTLDGTATLILLAQRYTVFRHLRVVESTKCPVQGITLSNSYDDGIFFTLFFILFVSVILISERACYKAQEQGKEFAEAYLFVKTLASLVQHPILFNFKANIASVRLLTDYTDRKYRQLLKSAITHGLASIEGVHLRLHSRTKERRNFKIRSRHKEHEINSADLTNFYRIAVLKNNTEKQKRAAIAKSSTTKKGSGSCGDANFNITLSTRKIAELLHVSLSYAATLAKQLYHFGLRLKQNRRSCSRQEYYHHRYFGSPFSYRFRYDKEASEFYELGASTVSFSFYSW